MVKEKGWVCIYIMKRRCLFGFLIGIYFWYRLLLYIYEFSFLIESIGGNITRAKCVNVWRAA